METFKPINGWTKEKIIKHFEENFKEYSAVGTSCRYRDGKGNSCAVGIFIPDNLYELEMESKSAHKLIKDMPELLGSMPLEVDALRKLQVLHDSASDDETHLVKQNLINWVKENVTDEKELK